MLNSDLPIQGAAEDKLNRSTFADDLAQAIMSRDTPEGLVIGMYGKWGSGKTSVINMVVEKLDLYNSRTEQKIVIMRFNPWLCADPKQLISQFFKQLSSVIKEQYPKHPDFKNICGYMDNYADVYDFAGTLVQLANLPLLGALLKIGSKRVADKAKKKNDNLQGIKDEINANLKKHKLRLVVTIDDIDRLSNDEIASVFQLVKSLADFPFTTYILAFDREIVIEALKKVQNGDGSEYLEKIVQVPYDLPMADANNICEIFLNKLNAIVKNIPEEEWDREHWDDMFYYGIRHYLNTVRDAVRYINSFSLKYSMLKNEVNIIDLIGLTCLQVFEPDTYSILQFHEETLCGSGNGTYSDRYVREKAESSWDAIIQTVPEKRRTHAQNILISLFPDIKNKTNRINFSPVGNRYTSWQDVYISNSISDKNSFKRYFSLTIEKEAIPTLHLEWLISTANEREFIDAVQKINSDMKTTKLLEYVRTVLRSKKANLISKERASLVLMYFCKVWHNLDDNESSSFFSTPFLWRFFWVIEALISVLDESERFSEVLHIFNDCSIPLSTIAIVLHYFETEHNRFTDENEPRQRERTPLLTLEKVIELEKIFVNRATQEVSNGKQICKFNSLTLFLLENIDSDVAKTFVSELLNTDYGLSYIISSGISGGKVGNGEIRRFYKVNTENIEKYISIGAAYERIKVFYKNADFLDLDNETKHCLAAFLVFMEKDTDGNADRTIMDRFNVFDTEVTDRLNAIMQQHKRDS